MHRGDVEAIGACIEDRVAAPYRTPRVPGFKALREAALQAGAAGAGLSGSGPALFAVCRGPAVAKRVARAMADAAKGEGVPATAHVARPEREVMHRAVALP
jgi:homoserine kinase